MIFTASQARKGRRLRKYSSIRCPGGHICSRAVLRVRRGGGQSALNVAKRGELRFYASDMLLDDRSSHHVQRTGLYKRLV